MLSACAFDCLSTNSITEAIKEKIVNKISAQTIICTILKHFLGWKLIYETLVLAEMNTVITSDIG